VRGSRSPLKKWTSFGLSAASLRHPRRSLGAQINEPMCVSAAGGPNVIRVSSARKCDARTRGRDRRTRDTRERGSNIRLEVEERLQDQSRWITQTKSNGPVYACVREHKVSGKRPLELAYKVATELILVVARTTEATAEY